MWETVCVNGWSEQFSIFQQCSGIHKRIGFLYSVVIKHKNRKKEESDVGYTD